MYYCPHLRAHAGLSQPCLASMHTLSEEAKKGEFYSLREKNETFSCMYVHTCRPGVQNRNITIASQEASVKEEDQQRTKQIWAQECSGTS